MHYIVMGYLRVHNPSFTRLANEVVDQSCVALSQFH